MPVGRFARWHGDPNPNGLWVKKFMPTHWPPTIFLVFGDPSHYGTVCKWPWCYLNFCPGNSLQSPRPISKSQTFCSFTDGYSICDSFFMRTVCIYPADYCMLSNLVFGSKHDSPAIGFQNPRHIYELLLANQFRDRIYSWRNVTRKCDYFEFNKVVRVNYCESRALITLCTN